MSKTIDERIVRMEFDNKEFEAGVKTTLGSLERLEASLNFDNIRDSFDEITKASKKVNLSDLDKNVSTVTKSFTALGTIGHSILEELGRDIYSAGKNVANLLTKPFQQMISGGTNRARNIARAAFSFQGLGLDIAQYEDAINNAVLDTQFGYDEAAKAAAALATTGIGAVESSLDGLEASVEVVEDEFGELTIVSGENVKQVAQNTDAIGKALLAISGVAAQTSSSYTEIADIFTTIAGKGSLMTYQLNQLSFRGLNAAAILAQSLGTTEAAVRDMVTKGQISFEMFSDAMYEAFAENAKNANSTFEGVTQNINATLSRIGQGFMMPIRQNSIEALNSILKVLKEFKNNLGPAEELFDKFSRTFFTEIANFFSDERIVKAAANFGSLMESIVKIAASFSSKIAIMARDAFGGDNLGQRILDLSENFKTSLENFKWPENFTRNLHDIFQGLWDGIALGASAVSFLFNTIVKPNIPLLKSIFNLLLEGLAAVGRSVSKFRKFTKESKSFSSVISLLGNVLQRSQIGDRISSITKVGEKFSSIISPVVNKIKEFVSTSTIIQSFFKLITDKIDSVKKVGVVKSVQNGFAVVTKEIKSFVSFATNVLKDLSNSKVGNFVKNLFNKIDLEGAFDKVKTIFTNAFKTITDNTKGLKLSERIFTAIKDAINGLDITSISNKFVSKLSEMGRSVKDFLADFFELSKDKTALANILSVFKGLGKIFAMAAGGALTGIFSISSLFGGEKAWASTGELTTFEKKGPYAQMKEKILLIFADLKEKLKKQTPDFSFIKDSNIKLLNSFKIGVNAIFAALKDGRFSTTSRIINTLISSISKFLQDMGVNAPTMQNFKDLLNFMSPALYDMLKSIKQIRQAIWDTLDKIQKGKLPNFASIIENLANKSVLIKGVLVGFIKTRDVILSIGASISKVLTPAVKVAVDNIAVLNALSLFIFANAFKKGVNSTARWLTTLKDAIKPFSSMFDELGKGIRDFGKSIQASVKYMQMAAIVRSFALALASFAGALYIISKIPENDLYRAVAAVGAIIVALTAVSTLVTRMSILNDSQMFNANRFSVNAGTNTQTSGLMGVAIFLVSLSGAIIIIAKVLKELAKTFADPDVGDANLWVAFGYISAIIGVTTLMTVALDKLVKNTSGKRLIGYSVFFISLAFAMKTIIDSLMELATVTKSVAKLREVAWSIVTIMGMIAIIVLATSRLQNNTAMSQLKVGSTGFKLTRNGSSSGMIGLALTVMAIAFAIRLLVQPLTELVALTNSVIGDKSAQNALSQAYIMMVGLIAIIGLFSTIGAATQKNGIANALTIASFALVFKTLGEALYAVLAVIKTSTVEQAVGTFAALSVLILAMAGAVALAGRASIGSGIGIIGIALILYQLSGILQKIAGYAGSGGDMKQLVSFMKNLALVIAAMGAAVGLSGGLQVGGFKTKSSWQGLLGMAAALLGLSVVFKTMETISWDTVLKGLAVIGGIGAIMTGLSALASLPAIQVGMAALSVVLKAIGKVFLYTGIAVGVFAAAFIALTLVLTSNVQIAQESVAGFLAVATVIGTALGIIIHHAILGMMSNLREDGIMLVDHITAIFLAIIYEIGRLGEPLAEAIMALLTGACEGVAKNWEPFADAFAYMCQAIFGEAFIKLEALIAKGGWAAVRLSDIFTAWWMNGLANFFDAISLFNGGDAANQNDPIAKWLRGMADSFTQHANEIIPDIYDEIDENMAAKIAQNQKELAEKSLQDYYKDNTIQQKIKDLSRDKTSQAVDAGEDGIIEGLLKSKGSNWLQGVLKKAGLDDDKIGKVITDGFAGKINLQDAITEGIKSAGVDHIDEGTLDNYLDGWQDLGFDSIDGLKSGILEGVNGTGEMTADSLLSEFDMSGSFFEDAGAINADDYQSGFLDTIEEEQTGKQIAESVGDSLNSEDSEQTLYASAQIAAGVINTGLRSYIDTFEETGADSGYMYAYGFYKGMKQYEMQIEREAGSLGAGAASALDEGLKINSPSDVTAESGKHFDEGFIIGIRSLVGEVAKVGEEIGDIAVDNLAIPLHRVNDILNGELQLDPTITPVMDTSAIEYGFDRMYGIVSQNEKPLLGEGIPDELYSAYQTWQQQDYNTQVAFDTLLNEVQFMRNDFNTLSDAVQNMQIVMDSGILVGQIAPSMDDELGIRTDRAARQ